MAFVASSCTSPFIRVHKPLVPLPTVIIWPTAVVLEGTPAELIHRVMDTLLERPVTGIELRDILAIQTVSMVA